MHCYPNLVSSVFYTIPADFSQIYLFSCRFFLLLLVIIITLDIEHLNTYHILLGLVNIRSKGLINNYTSQVQNLFNFIVPLHVLLPEPVPIYVHVHLHTCSWLALMTSELKGLTRNLFPCNKFISSCIDFVAMACNIMYCRTDMHQN